MLNGELKDGAKHIVYWKTHNAKSIYRTVLTAYTGCYGIWD